MNAFTVVLTIVARSSKLLNKVVYFRLALPFVNISTTHHQEERLRLILFYAFKQAITNHAVDTVFSASGKNGSLHVDAVAQHKIIRLFVVIPALDDTMQWCISEPVTNKIDRVVGIMAYAR